ncbi:unnamed protein product [Ambrosiozyma monospora]|uniref:Unnamed protein product n=1 Tax=Ambrosiozyma monospora TaxID=43982 RepID=A0ACB5U976_AMBMO|nr:unnamed protein product [Ambrosiozyma monospora]
METKENSTNSVNDSNNLSKSDFSSTGDEMSNTMKERLDESLGSYTHGALYQAVHKRSVKRSPITKEELWTTRSGKMKPVCTVTIADFSKTRYRLERRTVFSTWSHLGLLNDCDPKMNTKEELLNKLEASRAGLVSALRNTPDWSNMRWINVNGIEEDVFFAIIDEYKLNLKAVSRMSNPESSFDAQMYGDQLFCQLPILRKPKDGEVEDDKLARLCQSMMYSCGEVDPPSVDTFSTGTVKDHGWIFMPDSKTVISFFENSGEDVEEHVFFDFLRDLRLQEEMNIDASVCFENILNAFAGDLPSVVHELMRAMYIKTDSKSTKLLNLHSLTYILVETKTQIDSLTKVIDQLMQLPPITDDCKLHLLSFNKFLKQENDYCDKQMLWIKIQTEWNAFLAAEENNRYMFTLATVSAVYAPLSFVCSIFGMSFFDNSYLNYDRFYILHHCHSSDYNNCCSYFSQEHKKDIN